MAIALIAFIAIFVLIGSAGLLLAFRAGMTQRLSAAIAPENGNESWLGWLKASSPRESIQAVIKPFDKVLPKSAQEVTVTQKRLMRAGYREDSHVRVFYGSKILVPLAFCLAFTFGGVTRFFSPFMLYPAALGLGYIAPDFWLGRRIKKRQTEIRLGLPDFLDLLVVCVEAGLSLDQALARTAEEMRSGHPEISDETGLLILEQHAGRPRADAWKNLAERVDLDVIRTLVGSIIQADEVGTSIAKTLRIYADGLRVQRRQQVEEMAAKTAVKLVFPLVFFIFPTLFIVALGPTMLALQDALVKYTK
jgi:tight adherence protein C